MAEEFFENHENINGSHEPAGGTDRAEHRPRRFPLTWVILLVLLVAAVGMLASDIYRGRMPQNRAFELINSKLKQPATDESDEMGGGMGGPRGGDQRGAQAKPLTIEAVHDLLGRQPDATEKLNGNVNAQANSDVQLDPLVVETYRFPGIFKAYEVVVTYLMIPAEKDEPATTALKYVRKK